MDGMKRRGTAILAAGDFPRPGSEARRILDGAARVVCCDGAADAYRRRTGREPDLVVGDCDSLRGRFANVVRIAEQDTNDLAKAVRECAARGWSRPVVLGATGGRDDHSLANVFLCLSLGLVAVTSRGRFEPVNGRRVFRVAKGAAVSVFAPDTQTRMTSRGLAWPLDGVRFDGLWRGALNRASAARVEISSDRPAYIYFPA